MYEVPSPLRVFSRHVWSNKDNKDNDDSYKIGLKRSSLIKK